MRNVLPSVFMVVGFLVALCGLGMVYLPLALVVGGGLMFVAGGLATRGAS